MAKEKESVITFCPNCHQPAVRQGNEITCESCDATYTVTKKDGAKVKQLGRIERIEQDVAALKARVSGQDPEPEPELESAADPDNDEEENRDEDDKSQSEEGGAW